MAAFPFIAIEVGLAQNIFARHDLQIESVALGGDAKVQQALTADAADIGLGSGPALAFLAKGAPVLGVAALANAPSMLALVVLDSGPVKSIADLKGRTIAVTSTGSLTEWFVDEISRQQGWGRDGIRIAALGDLPSELAALRTGQIDGISGDILAGLRSGQETPAHVLLAYDALVKDFHVQIIYATLSSLKQDPQAVRRFLAAWFETVAFMRDHKDAVVQIGAPLIALDEPTFARLYDAVMPVMSRDGRFNPKALAVLAQSFVDLQQLPAAPDMGKLVTEAYLPAGK
ncbi:MAG TPA: ABC transporter substrate-binding protein [Stellaceae bacterium]|nr:ABC transporter substrate-binding protein [Stellaceae bacterium]